MLISQINVYPVKSFQGISLTSAKFSQQGLAFDRTWMVVDEDNRFVSQREIAEFAQVQTNLTATHLQLSFHNSTLQIELAKLPSTSINIKVWSDEFSALLEADECHQWLSEHFKRPLKLVRQNPKDKRLVDADYVPAELSGTETVFADGFPFLIANEASLNRLNEHLGQQGKATIPMDRFRANIVVQGLSAWQEHHLDEIKLGVYVFKLVKPCSRCIVTGIDQQTGERKDKKEPLAALNALKSEQGLNEKGVFFAENALACSPSGVITVGEVVYLSTGV